jgi:hypothetical protein
MEEQLLDKIHRLLAAIFDKHAAHCYLSVQRMMNERFTYSVYVADSGMQPFTFHHTIDDAVDHLERVYKAESLLDGNVDYLKTKIEALEQAKNRVESELDEYKLVLARVESKGE